MLPARGARSAEPPAAPDAEMTGGAEHGKRAEPARPFLWDSLDLLLSSLCVLSFEQTSVPAELVLRGHPRGLQLGDRQALGTLCRRAGVAPACRFKLVSSLYAVAHLWLAILRFT